MMKTHYAPLNKRLDQLKRIYPTWPRASCTCDTPVEKPRGLAVQASVSSVHYILRYLGLYDAHVPGIVPKNKKLIRAARSMMETEIMWCVSEDMSAERLNVFIDYAQRKRINVFQDMHLSGHRHVPLLKERGVWGRIRRFNFKGTQPGLELPPLAERIHVEGYNHPDLKLPASARDVYLVHYTQPGLVLPPGIRSIHLWFYSQPGLVLPPNVECVALWLYEWPDLVLPQSVEYARVPLLNINVGNTITY